MSLLDTSLFLSGDVQKRIQSGDYISDNSSDKFAPRFKSDKKAADYKKLIFLIGKIIDITNEARDENISFMSYSSYKKTKDIKTPCIFYRTTSRVTTKLEAKPRFRETISDSENKTRNINVYGQQFNRTVEFTIVDSTDESAEDTMGDLEDLILTYTGFFMSHGVSNIRFLEQLPDESIFVEEDYYSKTLAYSVTLEKITLQSEDKIQSIIQRISVD